MCVTTKVILPLSVSPSYLRSYSNHIADDNIVGNEQLTYCRVLCTGTFMINMDKAPFETRSKHMVIAIALVNSVGKELKHAHIM